MLSGIGPKDQLDSLGIPVVQSLPVGKTLLDHTLTILVLSLNITVRAETLTKSIEDFLYGEGTLTRVILSDAEGFLKTSVEPIRNYADIELLLTNYSSSNLQ